MIYPIIWMISSSFKGPSEIWTNVTSLIPKTFAWGNYSEGWAGFGGITFATYFRNSLLYAGFGTLAIVGSSAFIAYGFARIKFKGRNFWFSIMILTLMLPGQVLLIPQYILFNELGWVNTFLPLIVPRLAGGPSSSSSWFSLFAESRATWTKRPRSTVQDALPSSGASSCP